MSDTCGICGGPSDGPGDAERVNCDCGLVVCSGCCETWDGESYCPTCACAFSQVARALPAPPDAALAELERVLGLWVGLKRLLVETTEPTVSTRELLLIISASEAAAMVGPTPSRVAQIRVELARLRDLSNRLREERDAARRFAESYSGTPTPWKGTR